MNRRSCLRLSALLALGLLMPILGCQASRLPQPNPVVYPAETEYGDDLDIIVQRQGRGSILINNRTAVPYEDMVLWLNRQYVRAMPRIQIGTENNLFDLAGWLNQHGEKFPVGGLLRPEQSRPVVLAELFDPVTNKRHRLVVRDKTK